MRVRPACSFRRCGSLTVAVITTCLSLCAAGPSLAEGRRTPIVEAVELARPSIVNIHGEKTLTSAEQRLAATDPSRRVNGMGTGVIVDQRGYIITNSHVVDGVRKIEVTSADGDTFVAKLISQDPKTDLAVIKIDTDVDLPVIEVGTSSDLMTGETVLAVGNAFGYVHTVTQGIISALHRTVQVSDVQIYEDLIQTDASINPGNSGGPLLNVEGQMIGVNVAVRAGAQGIGFAIPSDRVMATAAELISSRRIDRTWHGVRLETSNGPHLAGVIVSEIDDQSPAARSGLLSGDVIRSVDSQSVHWALDVERALLGHKAGDEITVTVERGQEPVRVSLVLESAPSGRGENPAWNLLGLELAPMPAREFQYYNTRYRGGLTVLKVRPDSPAGRQGIRPGDVLVGMHIWETVSLDNVLYVLDRPDFSQINPLKFYILRDGETHFGYMTAVNR